MPVSITVNGKRHSVDADGETPLLYVLRNDLQLKGARYGCGLGQCGACTVVIDGKAVQSCDVPLSAVADKAITTIEGIGSTERPHVLQQAFLAEQAAQCGYCTTGNLCRCGTHARVLRAIKRAAGSGS
jgi:aerobic-type carbon monoxide dehydrogenase small subunit (CoxS/CutS family)